ncbi:HNH endonuclease family protein [Kribbella sp. NPDC056345]|uniref:HNH endonuclease family protein n=1 Tax=Kribbella sp. NPDC056345 TaxID=3345789 RepID=UPI0035D811D1
MNRAYAVVAAGAAAAAVLAGCSLPPAGAGPAAPATGEAKAIRAELAKAKVVAKRPDVAGYARKEFGQRWTDSHAGRGGHNGCDTRNDVLADQLDDVQLRARSKCVVEAGTLADPYTGRKVAFRKADAAKVQIDHIYPLARAWDLGAAGWKPQRRTDFANDQAANLLAVDGATNASKGDKGPGEWMPVNRAYRCTWTLRYLKVANAYGLAITRDDQAAAQAITRTCPK